MVFGYLRNDRDSRVTEYVAGLTNHLDSILLQQTECIAEVALSAMPYSHCVTLPAARQS